MTIYRSINAVRVYYTRDGDPRPFGHSRVHILWTDDGEFVQIPARGSNGPDEDFGEHLHSETGLDMTMAPPAPAEIQNGMLKSAYLAASLHLRHVPNVRSAQEIRQELEAVIRSPSRAAVTAGPRAQALQFYRTGLAASEPTLGLLRIEDPTAGHVISLASTILVDWPFPEINPETGQSTEAP